MLTHDEFVELQTLTWVLKPDNTTESIKRRHDELTKCNEVIVSDSMITIPLKEYTKLLEDVRWLECLETAGVGHWNKYGVALALWKEQNGTNSSTK